MSFGGNRDRDGGGRGGDRDGARGGDREGGRGGDREGGRGGREDGARRPFFRRKKTCPFSGDNAPKIDYKDVKLLQRFISERGKIEKQEYWGLRGLAYRINKNRKGHYVLLNINAPAGAVIELERQLKINEDVLRYLTVKVDQFDVSSNKNRRDDRPEKTEVAPQPEEETAQ